LDWSKDSKRRKGFELSKSLKKNIDKLYREDDWNSKPPSGYSSARAEYMLKGVEKKSSLKKTKYEGWALATNMSSTRYSQGQESFKSSDSILKSGDRTNIVKKKGFGIINRKNDQFYI
jgi:hypothetical protein